MNESYHLLLRKVSRPANYIGDANDYFARMSDSAILKYIGRDLYKPSCIRKYWEWDYIAECAEILGYCNNHSKGIGLGVGTEPLVYYFSGRCGEILATDVYSSDTNWSCARIDNIEELYKTAYPYPKGRLTFRSVDMRRLQAENETFDFAWSCSSIEHVPSLKDTYRVYKELFRILKPGGHAILTTEFCVSPPPYLLRSLNALDPLLFNTIVESLGGMTLVGPVDLNANLIYPANASRPRRYMHSDWGEHAQLNGRFLSSLMVQMIGLSAVMPVGYILQKTSGELAPWESLRLPEVYHDYSDAIDALSETNYDKAIDLLKPYYHRGPGELSAQLYMHISQIYLEAIALSSTFNAEVLRKEVHSFLVNLPNGELQDSDVLSFVAYLLNSIGETNIAGDLYKLSACSPSALSESSLGYAIKYLAIMANQNRMDNALGVVINIFLDLVFNGVNATFLFDCLRREVNQTFTDQNKCSDILDRVLQALASAKEDFDSRFPAALQKASH
jgi:SAM-dependent methyltransferase